MRPLSSTANPEKARALYAYYVEGHTLTEIGRIFRMHPSSVASLFKTHGLKTRGSGGRKHKP